MSQVLVVGAVLTVGLSSLSAVEQGVQHVLADVMSKDINIINAVRQQYVSLILTLVPLVSTMASAISVN